MKTNKAAKLVGAETLKLRSLSGKAAMAEKAVEAARKKARLMKAKYKAARKSLRRAKKIARQTRKAAKAAASVLRAMLKKSTPSRKKSDPIKKAPKRIARPIRRNSPQANPAASGTVETAPTPPLSEPNSSQT